MAYGDSTFPGRDRWFFPDRDEGITSIEITDGWEIPVDEMNVFFMGKSSVNGGWSIGWSIAMFDGGYL